MRTAIMLPLFLLAAPVAGQRYLSGPGVALRAVLPPAPTIGTPEDAADRATFRATRRFADTPRWHQAIADTDESVPAMLSDFSPSAGRTLSVAATPALARLLTRMRGDVSAAVRAVKPVYARHRPFLIDPGPVCQPTDRLAKDFDYPSGHTSWGTAVSLVLAELMPDYADAILARGRDFGESRIICGAHNASAVMAGRQAAAAIVARLHGDPGFLHDISTVRHELGQNSSGWKGDGALLILDEFDTQNNAVSTPENGDPRPSTRSTFYRFNSDGLIHAVDISEVDSFYTSAK